MPLDTTEKASLIDPSHTPSTTTQKVNGSTTGTSMEEWIDYHTGLIILAVLIFIANVLAIQVYLRHIKVRRNLSNVLLVSLSISDLIAGVLVLPCTIYCDREFEYTNHTIRNVCRTSYMLQNFCGFSTIFHIITVTIEKYFAVMHPFRRINITTGGTYKKILITLWTMSLVFTLVPCFWLFQHPNPATFDRNQDNYAILQIVLFFGISLIILSYCYCRMFIQIHGKLVSVTESNRTQAHVRNERKTIIVFVMFFMIFAIGWLPWFIINLDAHDLSQETLDIFVCLRYLGAVLNPLVYAFLKNDYKEAVQIDMRRCFSLCPLHANKLSRRRPRSASENHTTDHTVQHSYVDQTSSAGVRLKSFQPLTKQRTCSFNSVGHSTVSAHDDALEV